MCLYYKFALREGKDKEKMRLIEELKWRGMIHDITPGTEDFLNNNKVSGYVGFDPTAASLGIGNLVPVMMLVHFQRHGHHPIALVGGATGRIGDPSGKTDERKMLSEETLDFNVKKMQQQLRSFLDFDNPVNPARMVNNYDWFKEFSFLGFLRDVGKYSTVNYMLSKDSVQNRIESGSGISFTEFSYQLIQGYDFLHLHKHFDCHLQFGGSDQFGNITAGMELIRKILGSEHDTYAYTCPLITKADGTKFGKSEKGNIFLDAELTSPYEFYQFWINNSDDDTVKLAKIFSLRPIPEIQALIDAMPTQTKVLQYALGEEMTERIHGKEELEGAKRASVLLHGKGGIDDLRALPAKTVESIFAGVPQGNVSRVALQAGVNILDFLAETGVTASKGDARRKLTKDKCIAINTVKTFDEAQTIGLGDLINDRFILVNLGKQTRHIVYVTD
jgi:tyrosyl-tRNA synthetase